MGCGVWVWGVGVACGCRWWGASGVAPAEAQADGARPGGPVLLFTVLVVFTCIRLKAKIVPYRTSGSL